MKNRYEAWSLSLVLLATTAQIASAVPMNPSSNVQPDTWAYTALRSLVDFSGCVTGNPAFMGNQALTRQEFAAVLNDCRLSIEQQLNSNPNDLRIQQNRAGLERLLRDFAPELASLVPSGELETNPLVTPPSPTTATNPQELPQETLNVNSVVVETLPPEFSSGGDQRSEEMNSPAIATESVPLVVPPSPTSPTVSQASPQETLNVNSVVVETLSPEFSSGGDQGSEENRQVEQRGMNSPAIATESLDIVNSGNDTMAQVTNVSQLRDVQPSDWAYEALRSLIERYGCITGYPDATFRGNQSLSRYEFAAGLNACLQQLEQQSNPNLTNMASQDDLVMLQRLQAEFATELADLRNRIDSLDGRTTQLEAQQFTGSGSYFPVVKFGGEVIMAPSIGFGGDPPGTGDANTSFNHLTRLQLVSTFSGFDRLRMELSTGNFTGFGFGNPNILNTNTALLSFQENTDNDIQLSMLEYRFAAFNNRTVFTVRPVGFSLNSVLTANSPFFDAGRGAISRFGEANPIFKIGNLDAGVGMDWLIGNNARLQLAYGANNGNNPDDGFLLGEDAHTAGLQFLLLPDDNLLTGLTFVYGYSPDGRLNTFTGSAIADASGFINQRSNIYAVSGTLQWRLAPQVTFSTWGGIVGTYAAKTDAFAVSTNYMFGLGLADLFQEGSLLGVMFGQPPKLVDLENFSVSSGLRENAESFHIEAFYRFKVNDNIFITPGVFLVTNPGNFADNNDIVIGTLRTTFRF